MRYLPILGAVGALGVALADQNEGIMEKRNDSAKLSEPAINTASVTTGGDVVEHDLAPTTTAAPVSTSDDVVQQPTYSANTNVEYYDENNTRMVYNLRCGCFTPEPEPITTTYPPIITTYPPITYPVTWYGTI